MTQKQKSVRELGGEIWAELDAERRKSDSVFSSLDHTMNDELTDFVMSILARHTNTTIVNDDGLEVMARPNTTMTDDSN